MPELGNWPEATFDARVQALIAEMERLGHPVVVTSSRRSADQQKQLYAKGRTSGGAIVTEKSGEPGDESKHQRGMASDLAFRDPRTGQPSYADTHPWVFRGAQAKSVGLVWGGDWTTLVDRPHVQMPVEAAPRPRGAPADAFMDGVYQEPIQSILQPRDTTGGAPR